MMLDKMAYDTQNYSDVQGLEKLRYAARTNSPQALHEVSKQFQAYLFQMALKSMTEANKAMSGGLFSSNEMDFYSDLYAKQLSLELSKQDLGLNKLLEENLKNQYKLNLSSDSSENAVTPEKQILTSRLPPKNELKVSVAADEKSELPSLNAITDKEKSSMATREEFIRHLWNDAKDAAKALRVNPAVLLAQAALETSWGKKILQNNDKSSTFNLFNIKADASWKNKSTTVNALEQENGILKQERATFRSYQDFKASFDDYVSFIKNNVRYERVTENVHNEAGYLNELQKAGFATDSHYADKILSIFNSKSFNTLINKVINNLP